MLTIAGYPVRTFSIRTEVHARKSINKWSEVAHWLHNLDSALSWTTLYGQTAQASQVEYAWVCLHDDLEYLIEGIL